ncbi:MAG: Aminopeptidase YpdF [Eubacteriales bacterium SKADARSKE-1]|nr:Aminopeptidase YpdF [Eubacteriales bacterium SKADARSKE-1]
MLQRISRFIDTMPLADNGIKIDAALISSQTNRLYFSGFKSSDGLVFILRGQAYLLVDFRYYELALKTVSGLKVVLVDTFSETLKSLIRHHKINGILLENESLTLKKADLFQKIFESVGATEIRNDTLDNIILDMRKIKTPDEIKRIGNAQKISELSFNYILTKIKNGARECDLALDLEFFMRKNGATCVAFDLIVISGKNTSMPHGVPTMKQIEDGDFITIDMGAVFEGYNSDMTRTVALGHVSDKQKSVYNTVLQAQMLTLSNVKAGVSCYELDKIARDVIDKSPYKGTFGHALGHGVGLEVHEIPVISLKNEELLEDSMVITVEPGIYLKNEFGVRIEDMVVVEKNGCHNLTNISKDLIIL